mmetsp:Transcript_13344/g.19868  ORF Transcript_13344/g.19868 Transcript_13344/m.19868 type:complete len:84 (-) Transcript_13344:2-253(-)
MRKVLAAAAAVMPKKSRRSMLTDASSDFVANERDVTTSLFVLISLAVNAAVELNVAQSGSRTLMAADVDEEVCLRMGDAVGGS